MAQEKGLGGVWKGDKSEEVLDNMMRDMLQLPIELLFDSNTPDDKTTQVPAFLQFQDQMVCLL